VSDNFRHTLITSRDLQIFEALDRFPHTTRQLLKISQTFARPFTQDRSLRQRLQLLCAARSLRRWRYAIATGGVENYYTLTLAGWRILHGPDSQPASQGHLREISVSRQFHAKCLADALVHLQVAVHRAGVTFTGFCRENSWQIAVDQQTLQPDATFDLVSPQQTLHFFLEQDNHTETIRSSTNLESWERRIQLYEQLQNQTAQRFRVLIVTSRCGRRLEHLLHTARRLAGNPQRRLFYGIHLPRLLQEPDAIRRACFLDHDLRAVSLLPRVLPVQGELRLTTTA